MQTAKAVLLDAEVTPRKRKKFFTDGRPSITLRYGLTGHRYLLIHPEESSLGSFHPSFLQHTRYVSDILFVRIMLTNYQNMLHDAVRILQPWFDKKFHTPEDGGSWRNNSIYFDADNDYISTGVVNLSAAWYMAGHKVNCGAGSDMVAVINDFQGPARTTPLLQRSQGHDFLSLAREPFAVMSGILAITHPQQYNMARQMKERLIQSGQCTEALQRWPMVFTAVSVITNRESPYHRDLHEGWQWFDFLLSFGPYKHAPLYLANLGVRVDNPPGTICLFGGRALLHGVRRVSPRITLALYMRQNIQQELGIPSAGWMTQHEYDSYIGVKRHGLRRSKECS